MLLSTQTLESSLCSLEHYQGPLVPYQPRRATETESDPQSSGGIAGERRMSTRPGREGTQSSPHVGRDVSQNASWNSERQSRPRVRTNEVWAPQLPAARFKGTADLGGPTRGPHGSSCGLLTRPDVAPGLCVYMATQLQSSPTPTTRFQAQVMYTKHIFKLNIIPTTVCFFVPLPGCWGCKPCRGAVAQPARDRDFSKLVGGGKRMPKRSLLLGQQEGPEVICLGESSELGLHLRADWGCFLSHMQSGSSLENTQEKMFSQCPLTFTGSGTGSLGQHAGVPRAFVS